MWAPSGPGPAGWDRRRVGARLRAALAGLQELQGLRATQQARVRGALGLHPEPGPRGQELRLEAALAALREQLVRSERDAGGRGDVLGRDRGAAAWSERVERPDARLRGGARYGVRAGEPRAEPGVECASPLRLTQLGCGGAHVGVGAVWWWWGCVDPNLIPGAGRPAARVTVCRRTLYWVRLGHWGVLRAEDVSKISCHLIDPF